MCVLLASIAYDLWSPLATWGDCQDNRWGVVLSYLSAANNSTYNLNLCCALRTAQSHAMLEQEQYRLL